MALSFDRIRIPQSLESKFPTFTVLFFAVNFYCLFESPSKHTSRGKEPYPRTQVRDKGAGETQDIAAFNYKLYCFNLESTSWSSGNAFVSGAGGLRFKSRASQIKHSVVNRSPPLERFLRKELC